MASEPRADWRPLKIGGSYESRFSTDGRKLVVVGRSISVWDVFGRQKLYRINNPFDNPFDACFSPDDQLIAAKNTSGHIVVLAAATGAVVVDYKNKREGEGCNVAFSPCGEFLIDGT